VPKVVVVALVGGFGVVGLANHENSLPMKFGPATNFLIRMRNDLVDADFTEVVVDAPSDKQGPLGMSDDFRLGSDHLADIRAVIADLRRRFPDARIYLVGHSRGTLSAAALAATLGDAVQGVVLMSTATNRDKHGPALSTFNFASIRIPVLLVHHREDGCPTNPYYNAERLSKSFLLVSVSGGDPPQSGPCDSQAAHGYWGKDALVARAIKDWMMGREFAREIK